MALGENEIGLVIRLRAVHVADELRVMIHHHPIEVVSDVAVVANVVAAANADEAGAQAVDESVGSGESAAASVANGQRLAAQPTATRAASIVAAARRRWGRSVRLTLVI